MNHPKRNRSSWTKERAELLIQLWNAGLSCDQIAQRIPETTPHAVFTKAYGLGLGRFWTDERTAEVSRLWREGKSAGEIWKLLGATSRNAVIAKVNRLGLLKTRASAPSPAKLPRVARSRAEIGRLGGLAKQRKRLACSAAAPKPAKPKLSVSSNGQVFEMAETAPSPAPPIPSRVWAPLAGSTPVPLTSLGKRQCKWPIELADAAEHHACGRKREGDGPYCQIHATIAAPRAGTKQRLDERLGVGLGHARQITGRAA